MKPIDPKKLTTAALCQEWRELHRRIDDIRKEMTGRGYHVSAHGFWPSTSPEELEEQV